MSWGKSYQDGMAGKPGWGVFYEYGRDSVTPKPVKLDWSTPSQPVVGSASFSSYNSANSSQHSTDWNYVIAAFLTFIFLCYIFLIYYFPLPPERRFLSVLIRIGVSQEFAPLVELAGVGIGLLWIARKIADRFGTVITRVVGLGIAAFVCYAIYNGN